MEEQEFIDQVLKIELLPFVKENENDKRSLRMRILDVGGGNYLKIGTSKDAPLGSARYLCEHAEKDLNGALKPVLSLQAPFVFCQKMCFAEDVKKLTFDEVRRHIDKVWGEVLNNKMVCAHVNLKEDLVSGYEPKVIKAEEVLPKRSFLMKIKAFKQELECK